MSNKRVIHQEYLQMWLNGVALERKYLNYEWKEFDGMCMTLDSFNDDVYEFRKKPKLVKVDMGKFKEVMSTRSWSGIDDDTILEWLCECIVEEQ